MLLGLVMGVVVLGIVAYGFWMAGELGLAPRWKRTSVPTASERDGVSERIVREHGGP